MIQCWSPLLSGRFGVLSDHIRTRNRMKIADLDTHRVMMHTPKANRAKMHTANKIYPIGLQFVIQTLLSSYLYIALSGVPSAVFHISFPLRLDPPTKAAADDGLLNKISSWVS